MKMAGGRGKRTLNNHTADCRGDQHGMFTHTCRMADSGARLWFEFVCVDCGARTMRNTKGWSM